MKRKRSSKAGGWKRLYIFTYKLLFPALAIGVMLLLVMELYYWPDPTPVEPEKPGSGDLLSHNSTVQPRETAESKTEKNERKNLDNMDMPRMRVNGHFEPCVKLLATEEVEKLQFPPKAVGPLEELRYAVSNGTDVQNRFTGEQTMKERDSSYQVHTAMPVHCGFYESGFGFDMDERDREFLSTCEAAVSTCIFGGGDNLYQPIGMTNSSLSKVCYVAFWDEVTLLQMQESNKPREDTRMAGLWRVVVVRNLPFEDQRMNGKIPKMLGHRLYPRARYSIWVDSKYQFRRDPMAVFEALLWRHQLSFAISEHGARRCVYREGETVILKHKALPEEVNLQLAQYRAEGFPENATFNGHKALAEASVIVREHNAVTNRFMCLWFNEVVRYTARDQLSFPYVLRRFEVLPINMFRVCTRKALVNSIGHKQKARPLSGSQSHIVEDG